MSLIRIKPTWLLYPDCQEGYIQAHLLALTCQARPVQRCTLILLVTNGKSTVSSASLNG